MKAVRRMSDHRVPNSPMDSPVYANAYRPQPQMHPSQPQQQQMMLTRMQGNPGGTWGRRNPGGLGDVDRQYFGLVVRTSRSGSISDA